MKTKQKYTLYIYALTIGIILLAVHLIMSKINKYKTSIVFWLGIISLVFITTGYIGVVVISYSLKDKIDRIKHSVEKYPDITEEDPGLAWVL